MIKKISDDHVKSSALPNYDSGEEDLSDTDPELDEDTPI